MRQATRWAILLTVALAVAIAILTLMQPTGVDMPGGSDKALHFIAFFALAIPLAIVRPRWSAVMFVLFSAFGAAIEIIQPYVGRSRELADLIADMAGIGCGIALGLLLQRLLPQMGDDLHRMDDDPRSTPSGPPHQGLER